MQQASSVELMRAEADEEFSSPSWMDIRFRYTLVPMNGSNEGQKTLRDGRALEAEGFHESLDARERLSHIGQRYANATNGA